MAQIDESAIRDAYNAVRSDSDPTSWAIFKYDDSGKKVEVAGTGQGGINDVVSQFEADERAYAFIRVQTGDDLSSRAKFVFIVFVGEKVSPLKKARVSTDKAAVKEVVRDFSVEIFANTQEELAEEVIMKAVIKAMGANYGSSTN